VLKGRFGIGYGIALGLAVGGLFALWAFSARVPLSHEKAYSEIYVGMTREEVVQKLSARSIECALTEPAEHSNVCRFSDPWHFYLIAVDAQIGRVGRKEMASRGPLSLNEIIKSSRFRTAQR
jgi:hypothetical protein